MALTASTTTVEMPLPDTVASIGPKLTQILLEGKTIATESIQPRVGTTENDATCRALRQKYPSLQNADPRLLALCVAGGFLPWILLSPQVTGSESWLPRNLADQETTNNNNNSQTLQRDVFTTDAHSINVNNGSFGNPALVVKATQMLYQTQLMDRFSERFYRIELNDRLRRVRQCLSYVLRAKENEIFLVDNLGEGANVIVQSFMFNPAFLLWQKREREARLLASGQKSKTSTSSHSSHRNYTIRILLARNVYPMVREIITHLINRHRAANLLQQESSGGSTSLMWEYEVVWHDVTTPLLKMYEEDLRNGTENFAQHWAQTALKNECQFVVIDHVCFAPAFVLPVEAISRLIKASAPETFVFVDAAHAAGQIALDFSKESYCFDAWTSNTHKWMMTPKHCACMWAPERLQPFVNANVISNLSRGPHDVCSVLNRQKIVAPPPSSLTTATGKRLLLEPVRFSSGTNGLAAPENPKEAIHLEFNWKGTRDVSQWLTIPDTLLFRMLLGGEDVIRAKAKALADEAAQTVANVWNTEILISAIATATMNNVRFPTDEEPLIQRANDIMMLHGCDGVKGAFFPFFEFDGHFYTRLSAQVYNQVEDFQRAAKAFVTALELARKENNSSRAKL